MVLTAYFPVFASETRSSSVAANLSIPVSYTDPLEGFFLTGGVAFSLLYLTSETIVTCLLNPCGIASLLGLLGATAFMIRARVDGEMPIEGVAVEDGLTIKMHRARHSAVAICRRCMERYRRDWVGVAWHGMVHTFERISSRSEGRRMVSRRCGSVCVG